MTEPAPRRPRIRAPGPFAVIATALGAFFAVLAVLGFQDRVAAKAAPVASAPPPRRVIERRVILTRIVIHGRPGDAPARTTASPPPAATPLPAPTPAAPAPAPITTRSS